MIRGQSEPYHLVDGRFYDERGDCELGPLPSNNGVDEPLDTERGNQKLATFLIDLSPSDMQRRLGDALSVYVDAMRYPRGTEDQRASMWLEHTRRHGWKAVAAVETPDHDPDTSERGLGSADRKSVV